MFANYTFLFQFLATCNLIYEISPLWEIDEFPTGVTRGREWQSQDAISFLMFVTMHGKKEQDFYHLIMATILTLFICGADIPVFQRSSAFQYAVPKKSQVLACSFPLFPLHDSLFGKKLCFLLPIICPPTCTENEPKPLTLLSQLCQLLLLPFTTIQSLINLQLS